jgi:dTDP-4-dehydrorhamnose reductase
MTLNPHPSTAAKPAPQPTTPDPVLLIGVGGMLARAWTELLATRGARVDLPTIQELDLTDEASITRGLTDRYRLVINCAAWTDVDGAERNEAMANRINGEGVGALARRCAQVGATLIHYSTDYVFDGSASQPIPIDAPRAPINAYGRSKALGELRIAQAAATFGRDFHYLLVRPSWMYAPWGNNFVRTIARLVRRGQPLRVVNDQHGRPTSAEHLARTCLRLLEEGAQGTYHVCDGGVCSWFEFACAIAGHVDSRLKVDPCPSTEFPRPARRPHYSVMDLDAAEALVGPMPPWQDNLADTMRRLEPL